MRASFTHEDADFVGRNLAKARLGLGDALIAARGDYHWSCTERHDRMARWVSDVEAWGTHAATAFADDEILKALTTKDVRGMSALHTILQQHEAGVVFKLHPRRSQHANNVLAYELEQLSHYARKLWLVLEGVRLGRSFATARDYVLSDANKCPEQPSWRNALVNARTFRALTAKPLRYPRERLFHALALLLWDDVRKPEVLAAAQRELRSTATDFSGLVRAYEQLWHHFN